MPLWLSILLLILSVLFLLFLGSGVWPRYRKAAKRRERAETFRKNYEAYLDGDETKTEWLIAHAVEMQRDAESVGLGVTYVAPPPMLGGGQYQSHQMFGDLFNRQSFTDNVTSGYKLQTLIQVIQELLSREESRRGQLWNPASWVRIAFERLVGFPRYLLRTAGFSARVTDSGLARVVTVVWSLLVGLAGIGSFVIAIVALVQAS